MRVRVTYWPLAKVSIQTNRDLEFDEVNAFRKAMTDWLESPIGQWVIEQNNIQASIWLFDFIDGKLDLAEQRAH